MSVSSVPEKVRLLLWGKAAGRCEYHGCNAPLWLDSVTKAEFNTAYVAHIIADSPDGPRGDPALSDLLKADLSNLMLMCDEHHRLIDRHALEQHPVERLREMKLRHETRIELLSGIGADRQSHVLLYGANIGIHSSHLSLNDAAEAMVPERYPAEVRPIELSLLNSSATDVDGKYWALEGEHLRRMVAKLVAPRLAQRELRHISIFALAPQPLLMLLGYLLSDIPTADAYQRHREPPSWKWKNETDVQALTLYEPDQVSGAPALVLSLSATITDSRVHAVLGTDASIWRIAVAMPHNDVFKTRTLASSFRILVRQTLDRIKARHGQNATIHVFPAAPVAAAIDFGRVIMPKADLPIRVYDENRSLGGFQFALDLSPEVLSNRV